MKIATIQFDIKWKDTGYNLASLEALIPHGCDIVVLPEMFNSGFSMDVETVAIDDGARVLEWMKDQSAQRGCAIVGSVAVKTADGKLFNRCYFVKPDGETCYYDKRHLFRMAGEHEVFSAGDTRMIVDFQGWKIMLQVCYDLRFPVWSRNCNDYDLVIYPANWPDARTHPWRTLLMARAIENLCYVVGCNRVGTGNGIVYRGSSMVVDFKGKILAESPDFEQDVMICQIDIDELKSFREKFPAWMDADSFSLEK